jgi:hypothetical protein
MPESSPKLRRFVVEFQDYPSPSTFDYLALKACFNAGWLMLYGVDDELVAGIPSWRVKSVVERKG